MPVILFVDLLGSRARWRRGGVEASVAAFNHFTSFMIAAAKPDLEFVLDGAIETDAAAFVCSEPEVAFRIARRAYLRAFETPRGAVRERVWLRGAVVPAGETPLRTERPAWGAASRVKIFTYGQEFFDAVSVEKSGFRGMRLLVRGNIVTARLKREMALPIGSRWLIPFRRLRHSVYAAGSGEDLQDFLWMSTNETAEWHRLELIMSSRLRDCTQDQEEFAQAAATQVLFHEASAIYHSVVNRAARAAADAG
jgi:hypothetical protein